MPFWGSDGEGVVDQLYEEIGVKRFAHAGDVADREWCFQVCRGIRCAQENGGNRFSPRDLMELISERDSGRIRKVVVQKKLSV
jgi:hypothetical protein